MTEAAQKKTLQALQRTIVDALEDVKAQDIQVFNTEQLSPLFERVIIASGSSNRQTKALSSNVRDKVREAGFSKPRVEGEENGEWIIVDCGQAVAHIMQPAIRQYYNLEEIWGDNPDTLVSSSYQPVGKVEVVDGGFKLSGRWGFSSGCEYADWVLLGALIFALLGVPLLWGGIELIGLGGSPYYLIAGIGLLLTLIRVVKKA